MWPNSHATAAPRDGASVCRPSSVRRELGLFGTGGQILNGNARSLRGDDLLVDAVAAGQGFLDFAVSLDGLPRLLWRRHDLVTNVYTQIDGSCLGARAFQVDEPCAYSDRNSARESIDKAS